jgi:hypothetical protein
MKNRMTKSIIITALVLIILPGVGLCTEYHEMTTQELSQLRGTMYNASQEERDAFRAEWRKRIDQMSDEEKQQYLGAGGGRGQGNRAGDGLGDGTGRGRTSVGSGAKANGNGQGAGQGGGSQ